MDQVAALEQLLTTALRRITELEAALATMAEENADLRRQLAKNSGNSSKPPSSDGLKKPSRSFTKPVIHAVHSGCAEVFDVKSDVITS